MSKYPTQGSNKPTSNTRAAAPVAAAILAAGLGRRMGVLNKLVQEIDGVPMVRRVVENVLAARCERVMVVVGHHAEEVRTALAGLAVQFIDNSEYQEGLAASVRAAAQAAEPGEALIICLGDMPQVSAAVINDLIEAYHNTQGRKPDQSRPEDLADDYEGRGGSVRHISDSTEELGSGPGSIAAFQPEYAGKRGNPVLWAPHALPSLMHLSGDEGARALLKRLGDAVLAVPVQNPGILIDVDTPAALRKVRRQGGRPMDETTAVKCP